MRILLSHDFTLIDLGLRQPRLEGEEYISIIDELMEAIHTRWPKAIVQVYVIEKYCLFILHRFVLSINLRGFAFQFEDFQMKWAFETLQRYRKKFCTFNDDIQVITRCISFDLLYIRFRMLVN